MYTGNLSIIKIFDQKEEIEFLEKNLFLRVKLASNEIKRLCGLDWPKLLYKNLNRLIKNYKNVVLRSNREMF